MIPAIRDLSPVQAQYLKYLDALNACGFEGDLSPDYANRTVLATDNSIYQRLPQGVIYPKHTQDLVRIAEVSRMAQFRAIVLAARGGGTGTNGQSLTDGLVVDVSRYMNRILEVNLEEGWAWVEAGVVKDQLNNAVAAQGWFFAPELSTSNRATIGGMINTDASGQGSCLYGKTRDHVLELVSVLPDGTEWHSQPLSAEAFENVVAANDSAATIHREIKDLWDTHKDAIAARFPPLNRCLTGYDLAHIQDESDFFNLNSVLCGSEGTLGVIAKAKVRLLKAPKHTALVNVLYSSFDAALRHAPKLMAAGAASIETVDSTVMALAKKDIIWHTVGEFFPETDQPLEAINLVEFCGDDLDELTHKVSRLGQRLDSEHAPNFARSIASGDQVAKIWAMRKKAVGLLGNAEGRARPIPFVEDTCVPPEKLADFIAEFRAILDAENLKYGMFGHIDAGVLHVRPALNMQDSASMHVLRRITDQVVELTQKYGGLIWGEHGKGVRSEFAPHFFGDLYPQIQRVKALFDPHNQWNPGKIATPSDEYSLLKIDQVPIRGEQDRKIPVHVWDAYDEGMYCNGNGACFNYNPKDAMCPSWKATRLRTHSPKGRSALIREWLRQLGERKIDPTEISRQLALKTGPFVVLSRFMAKLRHSMSKRRGDYDFQHEIYDSMAGCLACKSCVGQCPIRVDVPEFRSKFLEIYHTRYLRPLKDYLVGGLEFVIPYLAKCPDLYNRPLRWTWVQQRFQHQLGMVDSPPLTGINLKNRLQELHIPMATLEQLQTVRASQRAKTVVLVQDAFTSYFETQLVIDTLVLLKKLGFKPMLAPYFPNGKPLHVHGFRVAFRKTAQKTADALALISDFGVPLVGIEPSMTLAYRAEYKKALGSEEAPDVVLLQEWLAQQLEQIKQASSHFAPQSFRLLAHCTEKTNAPVSIKNWQQIFAALGSSVKTVDVGCCGMAGTFGHESQNVATSKNLYEYSWAEVIGRGDGDEPLMATGYSCRSQVKRMDQVQLQHPVQALLKQWHSKQRQSDAG